MTREQIINRLKEDCKRAWNLTESYTELYGKNDQRTISQRNHWCYLQCLLTDIIGIYDVERIYD